MKYLRFLLLFLLLAVVAAAPACSQKSGCPANESLRYTNKKGEIKKPKRASMGLFSSKQSKRRY